MTWKEFAVSRGEDLTYILHTYLDVLNGMSTTKATERANAKLLLSMANAYDSK